MHHLEFGLALQQEIDLPAGKGVVLDQSQALGKSDVQRLARSRGHGVGVVAYLEGGPVDSGQGRGQRYLLELAAVGEGELAQLGHALFDHDGLKVGTFAEGEISDGDSGGDRYLLKTGIEEAVLGDLRDLAQVDLFELIVMEEQLVAPVGGDIALFILAQVFLDGLKGRQGDGLKLGAEHKDIFAQSLCRGQRDLFYAGAHEGLEAHRFHLGSVDGLKVQSVEESKAPDLGGVRQMHFLQADAVHEVDGRYLLRLSEGHALKCREGHEIRAGVDVSRMRHDYGLEDLVADAHAEGAVVFRTVEVDIVVIRLAVKVIGQRSGHRGSGAVCLKTLERSHLQEMAEETAVTGQLSDAGGQLDRSHMIL